MPRDGSGVYSKASASFAANTTIASSLVNADFDDLVNDANAPRPLTAGGTGGASQIAGWDGLTAKGTDIPSAATINLTTATGPRIDITGTTTITAVTLANGSWRLARATGAFQLTASASLVVNKSTSINYTTAVGDLMIFEAEGGVTSVTVISSPTNPLSLSGSSVGYTPFQGISTEPNAAAGPIVDLYRNSATPAAADLIAEIDFTGQNSTPAKKTYGAIRSRIDNATAASEAATLQLASMKAGTLTDMLYLGANAAATAAADAIGLPRGQLSFPVTQNPSSDANTLDDYEEGTFVPSFQATACTFNYATQYGSYTKVGNRVMVDINVVLATSGNTLAANLLSVTGLPFTVANTNRASLVQWSNTATAYVGVQALAGNSGTQLQPIYGITAAAANLSSVNANGYLSATLGTQLRTSFVYDT